MWAPVSCRVDDDVYEDGYFFLGFGSVPEYFEDVLISVTYAIVCDSSGIVQYVSPDILRFENLPSGV